MVRFSKERRFELEQKVGQEAYSSWQELYNRNVELNQCERLITRQWHENPRDYCKKTTNNVKILTTPLSAMFG